MDHVGSATTLRCARQMRSNFPFASLWSRPVRYSKREGLHKLILLVHFPHSQTSSFKVIVPLLCSVLLKRWCDSELASLYGNGRVTVLEQRSQAAHSTQQKIKSLKRISSSSSQSKQVSGLPFSTFTTKLNGYQRPVSFKDIHMLWENLFMFKLSIFTFASLTTSFSQIHLNIIFRKR